MNVEIQRGAASGDVIELESDICVSIVQKKDPLFQRRGSDLIVRKSVALVDALCGVRFRLTHLDGRVLLLSSPRSKVIEPGAMLRVDGEGFPIKGRPMEFGDLFILFDVVFPQAHEINLSYLSQIPEMVPKGEPIDPDCDVSFCDIADGRLEDFGRAEDEYEEEEPSESF